MQESAELLGHRYRFAPAPRAGRETARCPVLLLLHGTGGDEADLLPLGELLLPGAPLLIPRGTVSEQGAARFFRRLAPGVFDVDDLIQRTHALADFVQAAVERHGVAGRPVVAVGYSNGANIAASLLLLRPGLLAGAVLWRAMVPLEPEPLPDLTGTPVLLGAARFDPMIPNDNVEWLAALLRESGASVTLRWQDTGHGLTQADVREAAAWLATLWTDEESTQ